MECPLRAIMTPVRGLAPRRRSANLWGRSLVGDSWIGEKPEELMLTWLYIFEL